MDPIALHREAVVVDGHTDLPTRLFHRPADLGERLDDGHIDLPRLRAGGVSAFAAALYVPPFLEPDRGWEHLLALHRLMTEALSPGELEQVTTADDVRRARAAGVVGALWAVENGRPLTSDARLREIAALGARYVTLTHFASHEWCDASTDEPRWGGLSSEGVERVREMRRLGILADVSHVSDDAVLHTLDALHSPVIASHSSSRALCDHPRNLPDDLVREIARAGGVVMANTYPAFVDDAAAAANAKRNRAAMPELEAMVAGGEPDPHAIAAAWRAAAAAHPLPPVPLAVFVDHLMRLVELAGEEHVGVGTDFDGILETLDGFRDASEWPNLTAALLDRGLPPPAVKLILGENFLRALEEAERRAGQ
jgi:membrane dipeptidase